MHTTDKAESHWGKFKKTKLNWNKRNKQNKHTRHSCRQSLAHIQQEVQNTAAAQFKKMKKKTWKGSTVDACFLALKRRNPPNKLRISTAEITIQFSTCFLTLKTLRAIQWQVIASWIQAVSFLQLPHSKSQASRQAQLWKGLAERG